MTEVPERIWAVFEDHHIKGQEPYVFACASPTSGAKYLHEDHVDALEAQASAEGFDRGVQEAQPIVESLRAELHALYAAIGFDPTDLENGHDDARQALAALLKAERKAGKLEGLREAAEEARHYGHESYAAMMISDAIIAIIGKDATDG